MNLLEQFECDGIRLGSLQDGIDPTSVMGKAMLQIGAVFAEMERNLLQERTRAGLAAAGLEAVLVAESRKSRQATSTPQDV